MCDSILADDTGVCCKIRYMARNDSADEDSLEGASKRLERRVHSIGLSKNRLNV